MVASNRTRLIVAMNAVVAEKGYPATTITDIVAAAHVSRRTFYEQFDDKEGCLLASHELLGTLMFESINTVEIGDDPRATIEAAITALLATLVAHPELTYTHFVAMYAAGPRARAARAAVQANLAAAMRDIAHRALTADKVPTDLMSAAVVGGIGELIAPWVEKGRTAHLDELGPTLVEFVCAVLL